MQIQAELLPGITPETVQEYIRQGFRFEDQVLADHLIERVADYESQYGPDNVEIGEAVNLSTQTPWPGWHDGTLFSIYVRKQSDIPTQRTR